MPVVTSIYTVNPDGSGKVAFDISESGRHYAHLPASASAPMNCLPCRLEDPSGVDAWADLTRERDKGGNYRTRGTAYFPDITKLSLRLHPPVKISRPNPKEMIIETKAEFIEELLDAINTSVKATSQPAQITKDALKEAMRREREEYVEKRKPSKEMESLQATILNDITFQLPGTVGDVQGFSKDKNTVRALSDARRLIKGMDALMASDEMLAKKIRTGQYDADFLSQQWFGTKGFVLTATVKGDLKPLFDYKAETARAKAAMPAMLKKLATTSPTSQPTSAPSSQ
jgi:hypothetical protein